MYEKCFYSENTTTPRIDLSFVLDLKKKLSIGLTLLKDVKQYFEKKQKIDFKLTLYNYHTCNPRSKKSNVSVFRF